jgi:hypothetical protein
MRVDPNPGKLVGPQVAIDLLVKEIGDRCIVKRYGSE